MNKFNVGHIAAVTVNGVTGATQSVVHGVPAAGVSVCNTTRSTLTSAKLSTRSSLASVRNAYRTTRARQDVIVMAPPVVLELTSGL